MADKFDVPAARQAGYSDDEILKHLTDSRKFDVDGAVKSGYSKADIISHLSTTTAAPAVPPPALKAPEGSAAGRFGSNFLENSLGGMAAIGKAAVDPREALKMVTGMFHAHADQAQKAKAAWDRGDHVEAFGHALATAIPGVGPAAAAAGEKMGGEPGQTDKYGNITRQGQAPDIAGGLGAGAGLLAGTVAPAALKGAAPYVEAAVPAVVEGAKTAGTIAKGAATGAAKAIPTAIETSALKYTGAPQLVRGAINGIKATLAEKAAATAKAAEPAPAPPAPLPEGFGVAQGSTIAPPAPAPRAFVGPQPPVSGALPGQTFAAVPPVAAADIPAVPFTGAVEPRGVNAPLRPPVGPADLTDAMQRSIDAVQERKAAGTPINPPNPQNDAIAAADNAKSAASGVNFKADAQLKKATTLATALHQNGISFSDAKLIEPGQWSQLAKSLGVNELSADSISQSIAELGKLETPSSGITALRSATAKRAATVAASKAKLKLVPQ